MHSQRLVCSQLLGAEHRAERGQLRLAQSVVVAEVHLANLAGVGHLEPGKARGDLETLDLETLRRQGGLEGRQQRVDGLGGGGEVVEVGGDPLGVALEDQGGPASQGKSLRFPQLRNDTGEASLELGQHAR